MGNSANIRKLCDNNCEGFVSAAASAAAGVSDNNSHATAAAMASAMTADNKASAAAAA